jgi:hypothetical protein
MKNVSKSVRVEQEEQNAVYTEHLHRMTIETTAAGTPTGSSSVACILRVKIRLNSYVFQSWGDVDRWTARVAKRRAHHGYALHVAAPSRSSGDRADRYTCATAATQSRPRCAAEAGR